MTDQCKALVYGGKRRCLQDAVLEGFCIQHYTLKYILHKKVLEGD